MVEQKQHDGSFDLVQKKYLNLYNVKSVIFTKLELSTSRKRAQIAYNIDTGSDGNLMTVKVFRILFPKSTIAKLCTTKIMQSC